MPKLIYSYLASLDGYIADDQGNFNWAEPDEEVLDFINETEQSIGTYLYGRKIYEMMIGWEIDPSVAAQSPKSEEFARLWQRAQKIVFSSSLHEVSTERTRIERTFNPETVGEIKASVDHDLAVSGADLASTAWRMSLIDEVHLFIAPILVGGGQHMFPEQIRHPLELLDERRFGNGMVFVRYAVAS
jgi:dihydrofolate reductase